MAVGATTVDRFPPHSGLFLSECVGGPAAPDRVGRPRTDDVKGPGLAVAEEAK
jgi:hypothetical protein